MSVRGWPSVSGFSLDNLSIDAISWDSFDLGGGVGGEANPSGLHTETEITSFTLDEALTDLQRIQTLATSSQQIQRHSLLFQIPLVLSNSPQHTPLILPILNNLLKELDEEQKIKAAEIYCDLITRQILSADTISQYILPPIIALIDLVKQPQSKSSSTSSSPTAALPSSHPSSLSSLTISPFLHIITTALRQHHTQAAILTTILAFTHTSTESIHAQARLHAALLYTELATILPPPSIKQLLPSALPLCQDTSTEVRVHMCLALAGFAHCLMVGDRGGSESEVLVTELNQLLADEEKEVIVAALSAMMDMLDALSLAAISSMLLPTYRSYCATPPKAMHVTLMRIYGPFMYYCHQHHLLSADHLRVFQGFYKTSVMSGEAEVKYWCAYNLPALLGILDFSSFLQPLLLLLVGDPHTPVRLTIASSLPILFTSLITQHQNPSSVLKIAREILMVQMKDADLTIKLKICEVIPDIYTALHTHHINELLSTPMLIDMLRAIINMSDNMFTPIPSAAAPSLHPAAPVSSSSSSSSYTTKMAILSTLFSFHRFFGGHTSSADASVTYFDRCCPLLFTYLHSSPPPPLLSSIIAFFTYFLTSLPFSQRRADLLTRLIRECGPTSRSCYDRLIFLQFAEHWLSVFSHRWCKKHLLPLLAKMITEIVVNVKVRLCKVLALTRRHLSLPADQKEYELVMKIVGQMTGEQEYLNQHVRAAKQEMSEWQSNSSEEVEDGRKEKQEDHLLHEEEEINELVMKKEQQRNGGIGSSNSTITSSSPHSSTNTTSNTANTGLTTLTIMKQKQRAAASLNSNNSNNPPPDEEEKDVTSPVPPPSSTKILNGSSRSFSHVKPKAEIGPPRPIIATNPATTGVASVAALLSPMGATAAQRKRLNPATSNNLMSPSTSSPAQPPAATPPSLARIRSIPTPASPSAPHAHDLKTEDDPIASGGKPMPPRGKGSYFPGISAAPQSPGTGAPSLLALAAGSAGSQGRPATVNGGMSGSGGMGGGGGGNGAVGRKAAATVVATSLPVHPLSRRYPTRSGSPGAGGVGSGGGSSGSGVSPSSSTTAIPSLSTLMGATAPSVLAGMPQLTNSPRQPVAMEKKGAKFLNAHAHKPKY